MYGGLDNSYGSNNMKIDTEGFLNRLETVDEFLEV